MATKAAILIQLCPFEPVLPRDRDGRLTRKAALLLAESQSFEQSLKPELTRELRRLVRPMNCYYSNLIEGHHTFPVEIDQAMVGDFSNEPLKRDRQLEAVAHIEVQNLIEREHPGPLVSEAFIKWVHREFCDRLPEDMLLVSNPLTGDRAVVQPGEFRTQGVKVGGHIAPEVSELPILLSRFVAAYGSSFHALQQIIACAAAHHRLVWIHPFLDGNGRVSRLFTDAMLAEAGLGKGLWCVSRGFARTNDRYRSALAAADQTRQGDFDGRGNLTEQGLEEFCDYFLDTCLDQVKFMRKLFDPVELAARVKVWCIEQHEQGHLEGGHWPLLREVLATGFIPRGLAGEIVGVGPRQGRNYLRTLCERKLLVSDTPYGNVRLGFPTDVLDRWLPNFYPSDALKVG